jgi:hypothetical protein
VAQFAAAAARLRHHAVAAGSPNDHTPDGAIRSTNRFDTCDGSQLSRKLKFPTCLSELNAVRLLLQWRDTQQSRERDCSYTRRIRERSQDFVSFVLVAFSIPFALPANQPVVCLDFQQPRISVAIRVSRRISRPCACAPNLSVRFALVTACAASH